ncbi:PIG-L family deacetylase, partial [Kribbia dieselivorans]|uniref:PIG-L family deacetylase n=1 Tax=Kribbia dieselivorans TaxID=331526 RepID=UPI000838DE80
WLGHADSGHGDVVLPDPPGQRRFVRVPVAEAAAAVAQILREERADVVLGYDAHGGYGHPDHVKVHEVVALAAAQTGTRVLEATVPRDLLVGAIDVLQRLRLWPRRYDPTPLRSAYASSTQITHRIDVRRHLRAKRASMRAHTSQATSRDGGPRTLAALLMVPYPLAWLWLGHEWFIDPALTTSGATPRRHDLFEDAS